MLRVGSDMPDTFDKIQFKNKLIASGMSSDKAKQLIERMAAAKSKSVKRTDDLFGDAAESPSPSPAEGYRPAMRAVRPAGPPSGQAAAGEKGRVTTAPPSPSPAVATLSAQEEAQLTLFGIAPWSDANVRGLPNDFGRSALFTARNKRTPRAELKDEVVFHVMKDVMMTYTGTELRNYDDELVWLQVMDYAKFVPIEQPVSFRLRQLCMDLDWPVCGKSYQRIEDSLTRLQTNAVKYSSKRTGRLDSLSLIRRFAFEEQSDNRRAQCKVYIEPEILKLYAGQHFAKIAWRKYLKLPAIARRLYDNMVTHKEPFPLPLETFRQVCKSDVSPKTKWRQLVRLASKNLQESGLVKSIWVEGDMIFCKR